MTLRFNKILIFILTGIIPFTSPTPSVAEIVEKDMRGLYTILKPQYGYLSPMYGIFILRNEILPHIRFNGNYGARREGYICHPQLTPDQQMRDCPQDDMAVLIQQLFPSPAGGQLIPNNYKNDLLIQNLTPGTIGAIVREITRLRSSLSFDEKQIQAVADAIYEGQKKVLPSPENLDDYRKEILAFSKQIIKALQLEQAYPQDYPPYVVEMALLAFMVKKAETQKDDLLHYFEALGPVYVDDAYYKNGQLIKPKNWDIPFNAENYELFKKTFQDNQPTVETLKKVITTPEEMAFYTIAFRLYDQRYPQFLDTSMALFPAPKPGEILTEEEISKRTYTDCGEISLRNFFNAMLYDSIQKRFDVDLLKSMAPNADFRLLEFMAKQTPDNLTSLRNDWSDIVSDLNRQIREEKLQEKLHIKYRITRPKGQCNIDAGLGNLLKVSVYLLKDKKLMNLAQKIKSTSDLEKEIEPYFDEFYKKEERENLQNQINQNKQSQGSIQGTSKKARKAKLSEESLNRLRELRKQTEELRTYQQTIETENLFDN